MAQIPGRNADWGGDPALASAAASWSARVLTRSRLANPIAGPNAAFVRVLFPARAAEDFRTPGGSAGGRGCRARQWWLASLFAQRLGELRELGECFPFADAFSLDEALSTQAALDDPVPQVLRSDWPVLLLVSADDLIHSRYAQWKALLTSGFERTTTAQMPIGRPMKQHGEMHGIIAMMLAAIAKR